MLQVVSDFRNVVQPGRTLRSGRRGRWFESSHSDQQRNPTLAVGFFLLNNESCGLEPAKKLFDLKREANESAPVSFSERAQRQLERSESSPVNPTNIKKRKFILSLFLLFYSE